MLHIVNKSPFENSTLESCLRVATKGAALLLIEDGVYAATKGTAAAQKIKQAMPGVSVFVLWPDLEARGVQDSVLEGIKCVDYGGFVDLVAEHASVQSWL
jgi:tRNA 2-thiouridine synthesizing protein B